MGRAFWVPWSRWDRLVLNVMYFLQDRLAWKQEQIPQVLTAGAWQASSAQRALEIDGRWCLRANSWWGPHSWKGRHVPAPHRETGRCEGPREEGRGVVSKGREEDDLLKNTSYEAVWVWVEGRAVVAFWDVSGMNNARIAGVDAVVQGSSPRRRGKAS